MNQSLLMECLRIFICSYVGYLLAELSLWFGRLLRKRNREESADET